MKQDDTKREIIEKALELFSECGYDAVSVGEIAAAVGIKAPSLYNHYKSKQAIFDAIVEDTAARYVDRMVEYHANIFRNLIAAGEIANLNPVTLAYVSPVITLLGVCDRQPEREEECLKKLDENVKLFFDTYNISAK